MYFASNYFTCSYLLTCATCAYETSCGLAKFKGQYLFRREVRRNYGTCLSGLPATPPVACLCHMCYAVICHCHIRHASPPQVPCCLRLSRLRLRRCASVLCCAPFASFIHFLPCSLLSGIFISTETLSIVGPTLPTFQHGHPGWVRPG